MSRPTREPSADGGLVHALLYRRVSGAEHQKAGLSMGAQEVATRRYVAGKDGWAISGEYSDVMSGRKPQRPGYQAMLEHARQLHREHRRVAIVVIRLDRFGRNKVEWFRAAEELAQQGAEVHSISNGGVLDETHASILAVFAAKEAADIGDRVAETRSHVVTSGWHYGRCSFGYRLREATTGERAAGSVRTVIEPDPLTRGVVAECYERFAAGESGQAIAAWLASLPTELRGGRSWPVNCVTGPRGLLRSPTYAARPAAGVDDVLERPVANWEALVSDDVWVSVQARLEQSGAAFQRAASRTYLLSGYVRCPVCGLRMVATSCQRGDRPGERRYQYRCSGWARGANAPVVKCMASSPMAQADTAVLDVVSGLLDTLATPTGWPAFLAQWTALNAPATLDSARISELEREVAKLNKQLANAAGLLSDGVLDADGYNALRDQSTTRIKAAQSELERLNQTAQSARTTRQPNAQAIFELAGGWARVLREVGNVTAKRAVLDRLVKSVVIGKVGWRQYAATIEWQPLGTRLAAVVGQLAA